MTRRWAPTLSRATLAVLSPAAAIVWFAVLPGCGSGDDNFVAFTPPDAATADASTRSDARPGGSKGSGESGREGGGATAGDATLSDSPATTGPSVSTPASGVFQFDPSPIDWGMVSCGASQAQTFRVTNAGSGKLSVSAMTSSATFQLSDPTSLSLNPGEVGTFSITVSIAQDATPGVVAAGSLNLFTTDPTKANVAIPLSATASGAQLSFGQQIGAKRSVDFGTWPVGVPAQATFMLENTGNAPASFAISAPSDPEFSLSGLPDGGSGITVMPNDSLTMSAKFTASSTGPQTASVTITPAGEICGTMDALTITLTGKGTLGTLAGPSPPELIFNANCGGGAPASQTFSLTNTGGADVTVKAAAFDDPSFTVTPSTGIVPAGGGALVFTVSAPAYTGDGGTPAGSTPPDKGATLTITEVGDPLAGTPLAGTPPAGNQITLPATLKPVGSSLKFDPSSLRFNNVSVHGQLAMAFNVVNGGNSGGSGTAGSAVVSLAVVSLAMADGGGGANAQSPLFGVDHPQFTVTGQGGQQSEDVTFMPVSLGASYAEIVMTVDPSTVLCAPLPPPLALQGVGSGLSAGPPAVTFYAPCDGWTNPSAPAFTLTNTANEQLTWAIGDGDITGPGASLYKVVNVVSPNGTVDSMQGVLRVLGPSESAMINVAGTQPMPSAATADGGVAKNDAGMPWTAPPPADLAAILTIAAQFPDGTSAGPAVVSLDEIPVGDQVSTSLGGVPITRIPFGPVPMGTTPPPTRTFVVTNNANPVPTGSVPAYPGANLSFIMTNPVFSVSPASLLLDAGASSPVSVAFAPPSANGAVQRGNLKIVRQDATAPLCAPLPTPIVLSGSGSH